VLTGSRDRGSAVGEKLAAIDIGADAVVGPGTVLSKATTKLPSASTPKPTSRWSPSVSSLIWNSSSESGFFRLSNCLP
jgi:hypothetical protein